MGIYNTLSKHALSALIGGGLGAAAWASWNNLRPSRLVSSWGNYPKVPAQVHTFQTIEELRQILKTVPTAIARGNGRSYGDSALAPHVISSLYYNKFLSFDVQKGVIQCQAGVLLSEILEVTVAQGWFLPVTPGTKLITVGGAIASDVHGKSQHKAGNFSDHVLSLDVMLADGSIVTCSAEKNKDLFWTTCGGMGLTGVILNATMRLIPVETAYIRQESLRAENLDHLMDLFEQSESWTYSVAWIDCLTKGNSMGRGFIMRGEHATIADMAGDKRRKHPLEVPWKPKLIVPFDFPEFFLNSLTVKAFNFVLFHKNPKKVVRSIVDYDEFFYPLDIIYQWNRIYGQRGFTQYQFILPKAHSRAGLKAIMQKIADANLGSFLTVLKLYGPQQGYLPFAMSGYALALDFPIRDDLFDFLDELDKLVLSYGGRLYLTKDVRMNATMLRETYPHLEQFLHHLQQVNDPPKFRSLQSDRVGLTQPKI